MDPEFSIEVVVREEEDPEIARLVKTISWCNCLLALAAVLALAGLFFSPMGYRRLFNGFHNVNDEPFSIDPSLPTKFTSNSENPRSCDEFYVVKEGETLYSIIDKCRDPYVLENNPHVHYLDDMIPGVIVKISAPSRSPEKSLIRSSRFFSPF